MSIEATSIEASTVASSTLSGIEIVPSNEPKAPRTFDTIMWRTEVHPAVRRVDLPRSGGDVELAHGRVLSQLLAITTISPNADHRNYCVACGYADHVGATTAWLDDDEMEAWRAFIETVVDLMGALEADLAEHHLTMGDYQVLVFLSEVPDHAMRMCDLAARLQLSPSGVATVGRTRTGRPRERQPSVDDRRK